jgi:hypothetical protein
MTTPCILQILPKELRAAVCVGDRRSCCDSEVTAFILGTEQTSLTSVTGLPRWFMLLWCVVMPITSFLIIPSIQGIIPA